MFRNRYSKITRKKIGRILAVMLVGGLLLLGLDKIGWLGWLRSLGERVVVVPIRQYQHDRFLADKLNSDYCKTVSDAELTAIQVSVGNLNDENKKLNRLLAIAPPAEWGFLKQKVIEVGGDRLVLYGGSQEGAVEKMPVLSAEESLVYVGQVARVTQNQTEIILPSAYGSRMEVVVISNDEPYGIAGRGLAVGRGAGRIEIEQILSNETVQNGNLAVYQYRGKMLLVGEVDEIKLDDGGMFKTALIKPAVNPIGLLTVFLVK